MSDWTWEYDPDSAHVVGGLDGQQVAEVEALIQRITDAVTVRRIGHPFNAEEGASGLRIHDDGDIAIWYQEDYRDDTVLVYRVQHLGPSA